MNLSFDLRLATEYKSQSQKIRILTEHWVGENVFCPACGSPLHKFENNRPVADFYCPACGQQYELKSKADKFGHKISDGAYKTMIRRITSNDNPNFLFLSYSKEIMMVKNLLVIPRFFIVPSVIEKRKPLAPTARRAGWVGCNILIERIPELGRIFIVKDSKSLPRDEVLKQWQNIAFMQRKDLNTRGWLIDVMNCVYRIPGNTFTLTQVYECEHWLESLHPENHNVKAKIRQQLQIMRDKGLVEFVSRGRYRKIV